MTPAMELSTASLSAVIGNLPLTLPASAACATAVQVTALGRRAVRRRCSFLLLQYHLATGALFSLCSGAPDPGSLTSLGTACALVKHGPVAAAGHMLDRTMRTTCCAPWAWTPRPPCRSDSRWIYHPIHLGQACPGCTLLITVEQQDVTAHTSKQVQVMRPCSFYHDTVWHRDCPPGRS